MRGGQLVRQWRIIRAIEASPNGLTVTEIAQREETEIRACHRDLSTFQTAGFPLYTERGDRSNRRPSAFIDTFKFKIPLPFTLTDIVSLYFYDKRIIEAPATYPIDYKSVDVLPLSRSIKVNG